jgi:hypothetical protein
VIDSRSKGRRSERDVELAFQRHGFSTDRNLGGRLQISGDITCEGFAIEVRNREKLSLQRWSAEHELSTPDHLTPAVVYRSNRHPWRVSMRLEDFLDLLEEARS